MATKILISTKTADQYLKDNNLDAVSGLSFTVNDYHFIVENKFKTIYINKDKRNREEVLDLVTIINRINYLYKIVLKNPYAPIKHSAVEKILYDNMDLLIQ